MEEVTLGNCRLFRGDCREILPTLGQVDAIVTDPPYGVGLGHKNDVRRKSGYGCSLGKQSYRDYEDTYANFCEQIIPGLNMALDRGSCAAVFTGPHIHEQRKPTAIGGIYIPRAAGRTPWGSKNFLPVLFYGNPPQPGQHRPLVQFGNDHGEQFEHPCVKPLVWLRWLVRLSSRPGKIVLDPYMGSGTTGVACVELGRSFIGIELEPCYFDIACARIEQAQRQLSLPLAPPAVQLALGVA